jgi:hypothetical protein
VNLVTRALQQKGMPQQPSGMFSALPTPSSNSRAVQKPADSTADGTTGGLLGKLPLPKTGVKRLVAFSVPLKQLPKDEVGWQLYLSHVVDGQTAASPRRERLRRFCLKDKFDVCLGRRNS